MEILGIGFRYEGPAVQLNLQLPFFLLKNITILVGFVN